MKCQYGTKYTYVHESPEIAKALEALTGRKTLRPEDIKALGVLGIEVNVYDPYIVPKDW